MFFLFSVIAIIVPVVYSQTLGNCPNGWVRYGTSCYGFMLHGNQPWAGAGFICSLYHAKLSEIETTQENAFLKSRLTDMRTAEHFWIGAMDVLTEGAWVWMFQQNDVSFKDWAIGKPDEGGNEDCAVMESDYGFQWNDYPCSNRYSFICEKE